MLCTSVAMGSLCLIQPKRIIAIIMLLGRRNSPSNYVRSIPLSIPLIPSITSSIISCSLHLINGKMKHREVKKLLQSHPAGKKWSHLLINTEPLIFKINSKHAWDNFLSFNLSHALKYALHAHFLQAMIFNTAKTLSYRVTYFICLDSCLYFFFFFF